MANSMMRLPISLRSFSVSASSSSNGSPPVIGGSSGGSGGGLGPMIVELPLEKIRRPLMKTRSNDQNKVKELMDSISQIGLQVPIDVIEVEGAYYGLDTVLHCCCRILGLSQVRGASEARASDYTMQNPQRN